MKKWIKIALWSLFFIGLIVVGVFINNKLSQRLVPEPEIALLIEDNNTFITTDELKAQLKLYNLWNEEMIQEDLDVEEIEKFLESISQVRSAEVYQKINGNWKITVELRKPIARIFNLFGETFYLDTEGNSFETTSSHSVRTLVISGHIPDRPESFSVDEIINNDSLISIRKLDDIYRISDYVCNDPLFHSLVGQVHLKKNGDFVLIPLVGDQKIIFGSAYSKREVEEKFEKLKIFYEEALPYEGWNTYSEISLKYDDQVVCKKKNTNE